MRGCVCARLHSSFAFCREGQASANVGLGEVGKVGQNLRLTHSSGQIAQNVVDGNAQPANAWLAATLAGVDRNDLRVVDANLLWRSRS